MNDFDSDWTILKKGADLDTPMEYCSIFFFVLLLQKCDLQYISLDNFI